MDKSMERVSPDKGESLKKLFAAFQHGLGCSKSKAPQDFLKSIGLDTSVLQIGFNSGQFHHRKGEEYCQQYVKYGVLVPSDAAVRSPEMKAYTVFGNYSVTFPLKDEVGDIVNLYAYRFKIQTPKGEYLNNEGVYPAFPGERTTRLFLTQNVIDAASLLQSGVLENRDAVIALNDGKTTYDIRRAVTRLTELTQLVIIGDVENSELITELGGVSTAKCQVALPEDSLNEMWLKYGADGLLTFINELPAPQSKSAQAFTQLSDSEFLYIGQELTYHINGNIPTNPTLLEMHFEIRSAQLQEAYPINIDLLNLMNAKSWLYDWTEGKEVNYTVVLSELEAIREELQKVRTNRKREAMPVRGFSPKQDAHAKQILQSPDLFKQIDDLIATAGVVGEVNNRLLLFIIASSYKTSNNLHAVIQSTDTEAGVELVNKIAGMIPELDRYALDVTTSRTFRYYGNKTIDRKLLVIPDYSGIITSKAISDLKRLQARNQFTNDAPKKNADGELVTEHKTVEGHTSSIGTSTAARKLFSNEPKTVILELDSSTEQTQRLIEYDCQLMAGMVDYEQQKKATELLQYILKSVYPLEVVNPHATSLLIPATIPNARALTMQLMHFTALIALFRQHQREKDDKGRVIVEKADIQTATDLFLNAVIVNTDELDKPTLAFFTKLKQLYPDGKEFTSLEVQQATGIAKTSVNRHLHLLFNAEYLKKQGHKNTGFTYKVVHTAQTNSIRQQIESKINSF